MASKLLLPVAVVGVGLWAALVPQFLSANKLLNFAHDFTPYDASLTKLNSSCVTVHSDKLIGCEDLVLVGNSIYTACLANDQLENRNRWGRSPEVEVGHIPGDKIYRWDLDTDTVVELQLENFPGGETAADRSFLGLDVNQLPDGTVSLYITNIRKTGNAIEKFSHDPKSNVLKHVTRIPVDHPEGAWNPNNIFSLPELDGEDAIYVTNDHYYTEADHWYREFEYFGRRPWSWTSFYSKSTGWKKVLPGMIGANGISGDKDPVGRKIYVSSLAGGVIHVATPSMEKETLGNLTPVQDIPVSMTGDNINLIGEDLYIAGPARGHLHPAYMKSVEGEPHLLVLGGPGSVVKRINTKQLGSSFYGDGYTADPIVETLIMDGLGKVMNMSTTVVFKSYDSKKAETVNEDEEDVEEPAAVREKGNLYVTGLKFQGIMKCADFQ